MNTLVGRQGLPESAPVDGRASYFSTDTLRMGTLFGAGTLSGCVARSVDRLRQHLPECSLVIAALNTSAHLVTGIESAGDVGAETIAGLTEAIAAPDFFSMAGLAAGGGPVAAASPAVLPQGAHGLWIARQVTSSLVCVMTLWRDAAFGAFGKADSAEIAGFADGVAMTLQMRVCHVEDSIAALCALLDACRMALVVTDEYMTVLGGNDVGDHLMRKGDFFVLEGGRLAMANPVLDERLKRNIADLLFQPGPPRPIVLPIQRRSDGVLLKATVLPVRTTQDRLAGLPAIALIMPMAEQSAGITHKDLLDTGFTNAEADLMVALLAGKTVKEYAQSRGRAVPTVRAHLKRIMMRLGVHRQADLVRVLLSMDRAAPE